MRCECLLCLNGWEDCGEGYGGLPILCYLFTLKSFCAAPPAHCPIYTIRLPCLSDSGLQHHFHLQCLPLGSSAGDPPPHLPIVTAEESQDFFKDWVHQVSLSEPRWRLRVRCRLEEQEGMQPASTSSISHGAAGEDQSREGDQNESHSLVGLGWGGNEEQRPSYCVLRPCFILPTQTSSLPTAPEACPGCLVFERGWAVRRSSKEG